MPYEFRSHESSPEKLSRLCTCSLGQSFRRSYAHSVASYRKASAYCSVAKGFPRMRQEGLPSHEFRCGSRLTRQWTVPIEGAGTCKT